MEYHLLPEQISSLGEIYRLLSPFLTDARLQKMEKVVSQRSRRVLTIFENTHHAHNISAILRSVDSFGFMETIFLYSNEQMKFRIADNVDRGSSQWLLPKRLTSIEHCANQLKEQGFLVALVSLPDFSRTSHYFKSSIPSFSQDQLLSSDFQELLGNKKLALIFGSELVGVSQEWTPYADMYLSVSMRGFCESLNVSVCAGILLQQLRFVLERQLLGNFLLSPLDQKLILDYWISKDYIHGQKTISKQAPHLENWFDFVRKGSFCPWKTNI